MKSSEPRLLSCTLVIVLTRVISYSASPLEQTNKQNLISEDTLSVPTLRIRLVSANILNARFIKATLILLKLVSTVGSY